MSFFSRKKPSKPVPDWASFFDVEKYGRFIDLVDGYFVKKKITYTLGDGELDLTSNAWGGENLGLINLAQMCNQSKKWKWKAIVAQHFDGMQQSAASNEKFQENVYDFSFAKPYIGLRLYNNSYIEQLDSSYTIGKQLTEDIYAILIFDLPKSVVNIRPEQTLQWNATNEELFEIGINNMQAKYRSKIKKQKVDDFNFWLVQGNHFFVPNIVFHLASQPQLIGTHGAIIGIPHRHAVLIYPIENLQTIPTISKLIPIVSFMHEAGPGSISDSLYWYQSGTFLKLPHHVNNKKITFSPPEAFIEMLDSLK